MNEGHRVSTQHVADRLGDIVLRRQPLEMLALRASSAATSGFDRSCRAARSTSRCLPLMARSMANSSSTRCTISAAIGARGMKTCRRRKPLDARMIGRQGVFQIKDGPKRTGLENLKTAGAQQAHNRSGGPMASVREWQFKRKFRTNAYGWRASSLAISRLKEAAAEIRSVAKSDPVAAGDGVVSLMERIWPAFQGIDTRPAPLALRLSHHK